MRPRRGIAMILAIVAIALVATAVATLAVLFAGENRLTMSNSIDAELRQLLLVGAADANQQARQWGEKVDARHRSIALPEELTPLEAQLTADIPPTRAAAPTFVEITAQIGKRQSHQRLEYRRADSRWQMVNATFGQ